MKEFLVPSEDAKLNVKYFKGESEETILLLHGGPGVPDYLDDVAFILKKYFNVISFDQRGTGKSICYNNNYHLKFYLHDINIVADYFKLKEFHLMGHSWGGLLAQLYYKEYSEKIISLFLCSPASGFGKHWIKMVVEELKYIINHSNYKTKSQLLYSYLKASFIGKQAQKDWQIIFNIVWKHYFKDPSIVPDTDYEWRKGISPEAINSTFKNIIKATANMIENIGCNSTIPIAILYGEYDFFGKSKFFASKRFPTAHNITLKDSGHLPWLQNPEGFKAVLYEFYFKE